MTDPHPRRRLIWPFALLVFLSPTLSAQTTQPWRPALFAYGSNDRLWIAHREPHKDENNKAAYKTALRGRLLPDGEWKDLGILYHEPAGLAQLQGDLAVLIEDGNWKRVGSTFGSGPTVPGSGPVLGWGASPTALYAVRAVEGGKEGIAATQPATQ